MRSATATWARQNTSRASAAPRRELQEVRDTAGPHNTAQSGYVTDFAHFSISKKIIAEEAACTKEIAEKLIEMRSRTISPRPRAPGVFYYDEMRRATALFNLLHLVSELVILLETLMCSPLFQNKEQ